MGKLMLKKLPQVSRPRRPGFVAIKSIYAVRKPLLVCPTVFQSLLLTQFRGPASHTCQAVPVRPHWRFWRPLSSPATLHIFAFAPVPVAKKCARLSEEYQACT